MEERTNMKKKTIVYGILVLLLVSLGVFAQEATEVKPIQDIAPTLPQPGSVIFDPPEPTEGGLGQNVYYSVIYDGEGEAAVAVKFMIQNIKKENLTSFTFEIPGRSIRIINAVQEVQEKQKVCSNWQDICTQFDNGKCVEFAHTCENWYEQPIWPPKYYTIEPSFDDTHLKSSASSRINLDLPYPVGSQETATLIIYYKVAESAQKSFGAFHFDFNTAKINYDTDNIRVAINVQEPFILEGGQAEVNYQSTPSYAPLEKAADSRGVQSQELADISSRIQWEPGYIKETKGLDPLESFSVEGKYAKSKFLLHQTTVYVSLLVLVVFIILIYAGARKIAKSKKMNFMTKAVMTGVASGIAVVIIWALVTVFMQSLQNVLPYNIQQMFTMLMIIIAGIIILAAIFGPAVYMGNKYGLPAGFVTFVSAVLTMLIFGMIVLFLYGLMFPNQPPIIYGGGVMMRGGVAEAASAMTK